MVLGLDFGYQTPGLQGAISAAYSGAETCHGALKRNEWMIGGGTESAVLV
jgi:hypothetical protein